VSRGAQRRLPCLYLLDLSCSIREMRRGRSAALTPALRLGFLGAAAKRLDHLGDRLVRVPSMKPSQLPIPARDLPPCAVTSTVVAAVCPARAQTRNAAAPRSLPLASAPLQPCLAPSSSRWSLDIHPDCSLRLPHERAPAGISMPPVSQRSQNDRHIHKCRVPHFEQASSGIRGIFLSHCALITAGITARLQLR